jgi:hypothetical protein
MAAFEFNAASAAVVSLQINTKTGVGGLYCRRQKEIQTNVYD